HARPRTVLPRLQVLVERKSRRSSRDLRPAGRRRGHCVYELERGHPSHSVACPCRGKRRKPLPRVHLRQDRLRERRVCAPLCYALRGAGARRDGSPAGRVTHCHSRLLSHRHNTLYSPENSEALKGFTSGSPAYPSLPNPNSCSTVAKSEKWSYVS